MKRRGYTMVEVMVVIGVIALLAGIGYPLTMTVMGRARQNACIQNLNVIGAGLQQCLRDNGERLPDLKAGRESKAIDAPVMDTVLIDYVGNVNIFHCPADSKQFRKTGSSYFWNSALNGMEVNKVTFFGLKDSPEITPLVTDKESWHPDETNILYADGSVSKDVKFVSRSKLK